MRSIGIGGVRPLDADSVPLSAWLKSLRRPFGTILPASFTPFGDQRIGRPIVTGSLIRVMDARPAYRSAIETCSQATRPR